MIKIAEMNKQVVIIGGGAAGFFAAVNLKRLAPDVQVTILEKGNKLLSKVRVSGGGRCNVTHACFDDALLVRNYPRGAKALRGAFSRFSTTDTVRWFEERGVELKTEADGRMFPRSDQSASIINCLLAEADRYGVLIKMGADVKKIIPENESFRIELAGDGRIQADRILIATGGNPKKEAYSWLEQSGHGISLPVPSLFTFNVPGREITKLMGLSVPDALVRIVGSSLSSSGPLLITHWGFSGPAILKLSAWGARELNDRNYEFALRISWLGDLKEEQVRFRFADARSHWNTRLVAGHPLFELPRRLWEYLVVESGISSECNWSDLTKQQMNKLNECLLNDVYTVKGKTTFKEEFVTCGGIQLADIDFRTMESRRCKGLYFAGEVLDIDGVTGGFNFQSAWTTGWIAANAIASADTPIVKT
jgi:predicted Rossmann fold flavoprotein